MTTEHFLDEKRVPAFEVKGGSLDVEKRTLRATVTNDIVDRDRDVIVPGAFKGRIATFRKNPIVLWNHDPFRPPIGKALSIDFHEKGIDAELFFRKDDELAQNIFSAFQQGILTSFSVGFRTFGAEDGKDHEGKAIRRITDAELFEISAVTLPANTDAVAKLANMATTLKSALYGTAEEKTLYGAPTDLDVLKRAVVIAKRRLEDARENKNLPAAERAAMEQLDLALKALLAPSTSDEDAKVQEELTEILSELRKAS